MSNLYFSVQARNDAADRVTARIDSGASAGRLKVYSGSRPATPDDPPGLGNVLLADLPFARPPFLAAVGGTAAGKTPLPSGVGLAIGIGSWFRVTDSAGAAVFDGAVGTTGTALIVNTVQFVTGVPVQVTALSFSVPMTCP